MKLALVRQRYNPFGGAERFIERAIASLERQGIEAVLITREWRAAGGQRVLIVDPFNAGRLWRDVSFSRSVRALLTREKFDLVQSHERIPGCDLYRAGDGVHRQWLEHRAAEAGFLEHLRAQPERRARLQSILAMVAKKGQPPTSRAGNAHGGGAA